MGQSGYENMDRVFHPRSMAAVGVADRFENMGMGFLLGYKKHGFKGDLYAVHPHKKFDAFPTYPSVLDIPGPVDFVKVCVPAAKVPDVIRDCAKKKVVAATVFSSGFRESGRAEDAALEDEVIRIARQGGVRLIGPNCMGIHCPETGMTIRADMPVTEPGSVGLISQSGGVAISFAMMMAERGVGLSKAVSYGNESDLGPPEFLGYLARDPATKVICVYIEGTRRPDELTRALADAAARKPVLVLKGGMTSEGRRAVESHTGALSGQAFVWDAAIRQSGAIPVEDLESMMDLALLLSLSKPPEGNRLALLTISGGFGVVGADQAHRAGFALPELGEQCRDALSENFAAPGTSMRNPVDLAAKFFQPQHYKKLFSAIDQDPAIDFSVMVLAMEYISFINSKARDWSGFTAGAIQKGIGHMEKPVYIAYYRTILEPLRLEHERAYLAAGYPVFPNLNRCLAAAGKAMGGMTKS